MTLHEAIKALDKGKKVKSPTWADKSIYLVRDEGYIKYSNDSELPLKIAGINFFLTDNFEIVKEIKVTVNVEFPDGKGFSKILDYDKLEKTGLLDE